LSDFYAYRASINMRRLRGVSGSPLSSSARTSSKPAS
jgi:hypothetical protein